MKNVLIVMIGLVLLLSSVLVVAEEKPRTEPDDSVQGVIAEPEKAQTSDQVMVYYFHMNRRCMTCEKFETYSKAAIETGFAEQLKDSSIVFEVKNLQQEGNEHFAKNYQLYGPSLILSRQRNGKETEWKNLYDIWKLVGNKEEFAAYVQTEVEGLLIFKEDE